MPTTKTTKKPAARASRKPTQAELEAMKKTIGDIEESTKVTANAIEALAAAQGAEEPEAAFERNSIRKQCCDENARLLTVLQEFLGEFNEIRPSDFESLRFLRLIQVRDRGCITPIEDFIHTLVQAYGWQDEQRKGLTVEYIERLLESLQGLPEEIERAHFMASRYPLSEPRKTEVTA